MDGSSLWLALPTHTCNRPTDCVSFLPPLWPCVPAQCVYVQILFPHPRPSSSSLRLFPTPKKGHHANTFVSRRSSYCPPRRIPWVCVTCSVWCRQCTLLVQKPTPHNNQPPAACPGSVPFPPPPGEREKKTRTPTPPHIIRAYISNTAPASFPHPTPPSLALFVSQSRIVCRMYLSFSLSHSGDNACLCTICILMCKSRGASDSQNTSPPIPRPLFPKKAPPPRYKKPGEEGEKRGVGGRHWLPLSRIACI